VRAANSEEAGSVGALSGLEDAKAVGPAPLCNDNDRLPPASIVESKSAPDGGALLTQIHDFVGRFICYPSPEASIAHVLWIAHAHLMDCWFTTPRLAALSPEPGSGKSRLLEVTALLVPRPILSVMSSPAYVLRKIADQENRPTVLYDEIDAIFGPQARGSEDLRAMVNAGYRRGATIGRCYGENGKILTQDLPTYGAVAFGGLGDLPATIMSRSIIIRMRKRAQGETVEGVRPAKHEPEGQLLHDELAAWAAAVVEEASVAEPAMPAGIADRDADVWMPLLVVAALAGGPWPDMARDAALEFVKAAKSGKAPSLGVQLLTDIRSCFGGESRIASAELVDRLLSDPEAPWGDLKGKKLNQRKLAELLRQFHIEPETVRVGEKTLRGYKAEAFHDSWRRYLPPPVTAKTSATCTTRSGSPQNTADPGVADQTSCCGP
jgi:hypothetical protein